MKYFIGVLTYLIFAAGMQAPAQGYCPVNLNGEVLNGMRQDPVMYYGKMLACNGEVLKIERGSKGLPYYQLKLEKGGDIWISGQVEGGFEQIGAKIRVLGFFEKAAAGYKPSGVNSEPFHLVGIALLDLKTGELMMQPGQEKIVQQWLDGVIPDPGKRKWEN